MFAATEPDAILLQSVSQARLRDSLSPQNMLKQNPIIRMKVITEPLAINGNHSGQQQSAKSGRWIERQYGVA
jgi:hypothetical protein